MLLKAVDGASVTDFEDDARYAYVWQAEEKNATRCGGMKKINSAAPVPDWSKMC